MHALAVPGLFLVAALAICHISSPALAVIITLEPDNFPDFFADLTHAVPGVTATIDQRPELVVRSSSEFVRPSTGTRGFLISGPGGFTGLFFNNSKPRFDFDSVLAATSVSLDFIADAATSASEPFVARLDAYSALDVLLVSSVVTMTSNGAIQTATVRTPTPQISRVIASLDSTSQRAGYFDNFRAEVEVIPEPAHLGLLATGATLMFLRCRRLV